MGLEKTGEYVFDRRKELGRGSFGAVYEGSERRNMRNKVAVKVIKKSKDMDFKRELNMLKLISGLNHENFVKLLHSEEDFNEIILVMEFCNEDMASYLRKEKKLPEASVVIFLRQIVEGLKVLDYHKIIHRDLKPENLLLVYKEQNSKPENIILKIGDFGLARFLPTNNVQNLTQCGTLCYMAPEAFSPHYDSKVDIWSVGLIVHYMLFGPDPSLFTNLMMQNYTCPSTASSLVKDLLNRMLKKNPVERTDIGSLAAHPFLGTDSDKRRKVFESDKMKHIPESDKMKRVSDSEEMEKVKQCRDKHLPGQMTRDRKRDLYHINVKPVQLENIKSWDVDNNGRYASEMTQVKNGEINKKISIWQGDITQLEIDAIVNAANESLRGGAGVDGAIHRAAGPNLLKENIYLLKYCPTGEAKTAAGYNLPAYYVIHTVGPTYPDKKFLRKCYENCLAEVLKNNIKTVAFPAIVTGIYGFPLQEAAEIAVETTRNWLEELSSEVERIIFCVWSGDARDVYYQTVSKYFPR